MVLLARVSCLFAYISVCLSACLFVCLSVCLLNAFCPVLASDFSPELIRTRRSKSEEILHVFLTEFIVQRAQHAKEIFLSVENGRGQNRFSGFRGGFQIFLVRSESILFGRDPTCRTCRGIRLPRRSRLARSAARSAPFEKYARSWSNRRATCTRAQPARRRATREPAFSYRSKRLNVFFAC
jgi:hypothetical protein